MYKDNLEELVQEFKPLVEILSHSYTVKGMEPEDLQQEFFIILLKCNKNFDATKHTQFKTYFKHSCMNKLKNYWSKKDEVQYILNDLMTDGEERLDKLASYDTDTSISDLVDRLDNADITKLVLKGETFREISALLGMPLSTVYYLHQRNIDQLRKLI